MNACRQLLGALTWLAVVAQSVAAPVDYLRDIKPLLSGQCGKCHGALQQKGGLRLDTAAAALVGGEHGPAIKPGASADSLLVRLVEGTHADLARMPYKKPPLAGAQVALLKAWIDEGAKAPSDEQPEVGLHWSFVPPVRPSVPKISRLPFPVSHPIDAFIFARLEKDGLQPSPAADRVTLIRRLSLDLLGLPPTLTEVDAFLAEARPDAYERLVERLLASPHYGERWGRRWLDVARYADSNGYSIDAPRQIWKYRDWVVAALNRDLPFDQFALWQLAGDLIETNTLPPGISVYEPRIATGFHRNTQINEEGGIDKEQFRIESIIDRVNTTATAFLGLTLACAQCHDHKFDPLTQKDYFRFYAFLNNADEPTLELVGEPAVTEQVHQQIQEIEDDLDRYINTVSGPQLEWEQTLTDAAKAAFKPAARKALTLPAAERTKPQKRALYALFHKDDPEYKKRATKLAALEKKERQWLTTLVLTERPQPRESFVFIKGDFTRKGAVVTPDVPAALPPLPTTDKTNRLALARWIVDAGNPLTARVLVNRVWQEYFGRGLVETENDFGTQGSPPTHPELLDWLASEFMSPTVVPGAHPAPPWSLKHLHRLIVTSATYRQSSRARAELHAIDANNKLLARQSRLRLDAEIVRDVGLAASGLLDDQIGGPGVFPPQPDGVMSLGQSKRDWKASTGTDRYRRGLYTHYWRATPHPALAVFDAPDAFSACTRRLRSNTPLQALTLLNDQQFFELAQGLAARVLREAPGSDSARIERAFRLCLARPPTVAEQKRLLELLSSAPPPDAGAPEVKPPPGVTSRQLSAWTTIARVLLNLDETITRE